MGTFNVLESSLKATAKPFHQFYQNSKCSWAERVHLWLIHIHILIIQPDRSSSPWQLNGIHSEANRKVLKHNFLLLPSTAPGVHMLLSLACEDEKRKQTIKPASLRTFYSRYSQSVDHSQTHTHTHRTHTCVLAHTLCDTEASPAQGHSAKGEASLECTIHSSNGVESSQRLAVNLIWVTEPLMVW